MYQKIYKGGLVVFALLLVFSIIFYKERAILLDDSFYLFNIVSTDSFVIQHFRYIAAVTQVFPLMASRLGLPLGMVAMSYSASFIIYYFICYIICGTVLKQYKVAITLVLYLILFSTHTMFWMLSEFILAVAMLCVLIAYMASDHYRKRKWLSGFVILVLVPTMAFAYLPIAFLLSFYMTYLYLRREPNFRFRDCVLILAVFVASLAVKFIFFQEPYDKGVVGGGLRHFIDLFPNYIDIHSVRRLVKNCIIQYQWIPILFFILTAFYIRSRQWLLLGLFFVYFIGYGMLVCISFPGEDMQDLYIENLFLPLGLFLAVPFIYDVLSSFKTTRTAYVFMVLIVGTAFIRIAVFQKFYSTRLNWLRDYLAQHAHEKRMVGFNYLPREVLVYGWASPYEFWLLSTIEEGKTASILFSDNIDDVAWAAPNQKSFVGTWGVFEYSTLNPQYFKFADTTTGYRVIR